MRAASDYDQRVWDAWQLTPKHVKTDLLQAIEEMRHWRFEEDGVVRPLWLIRSWRAAAELGIHLGEIQP